MRRGLRMRGARGRPEVRKALIRYADWLRKNYEFPIRVPVYLSPREELVSLNGELASATFFGPYDQNVEPYIRIATGDYPERRRLNGRDIAIVSYMVSLSHEVIHYQQWVRTGDMSERGVVVKARAMVQAYIDEIRWYSPDFRDR